MNSIFFIYIFKIAMFNKSASYLIVWLLSWQLCLCSPVNVPIIIILLFNVTVLHRDTIVYRRGHRNLPARPSKMTGAAIETYRRGHRIWPARPSKPTDAAIENDRRGHRNRCVYRPSKMTGAAIETYRRGHRKWPAWPSKPTGAAIETYRPVILDGRAGHFLDGRASHFRWPRRSFSMAAPVAAMAAPVAAIATHLCPYDAQYNVIYMYMYI